MVTACCFPEMGEGITSGMLVKWHVREGEAVSKGQVLCEIEIDKAVVKLPASMQGIIRCVNKKEGEVIKVGEVLAELEGSPGVQHQASASPSSSKTPENQPVPQGPAPLSSGLGAHARASFHRKQPVKGSGRAGTVGRSDGAAVAQGKCSVAAALQEEAQGTKPVPDAGAGSSLPLVGFGLSSLASQHPTVGRRHDLYGYVEHVQLKGLRRAVSEHKDESHLRTAAVTHMDEADVTRLHEVREQEKTVYGNKGIKLTYLPFVIKAVTLALRHHPYLNASLDEQTGEIVLKKYYNIGIACDTTEGLVVPVIRNAHQKSIVALSKEIQAFGAKAKDRSINPVDLRGGTFTVANAGPAGAAYFTPIIHHPQAAVLGMGRLCEKVVVRDKTIDVRQMLPLSLTFDHRVVDGAQAARFMNDLKKHLENPQGLLLEMDF